MFQVTETCESVRDNSTLAPGHIQGNIAIHLRQNPWISGTRVGLLRLGHMQWNSEFGPGQQCGGVGKSIQS